MPVNPELRLLDIAIPAQPESLVRLSLLLAEEDVNLQALAALIESDMALAAAVLKAVNSSLYGLSGRVQSVQQAITYLGTREVAAVTFEMGLRAVFPAAPELKPIWDRAAQRGLLMGRIGAELGVDPWVSHSAGLFEECGKAVLFRHSRQTLRADAELARRRSRAARARACRVRRRNDKLGAALCETWGLAPAAVASVRHHVTVHATRELPPQVPRPAVCALSALAHALMTAPDTLDEVAAAVAPQAQLDETLVLRAARKVQVQLVAAALRE